MAVEFNPRSWKSAMLRGWRCKCPSCGRGELFASYLKTSAACSVCGTEFHHHRADDLPPYVTMMIVGHVVVPGMLAVEKFWRPELWIHAAIWLPLTLGLSLWLMPRVKGAVVGLQWANRMHGFGEDIVIGKNSTNSPLQP